MDKLSLIKEPSITVGRICFSCALFSTGECPYGNHKRISELEYIGDIRGKCTFYQMIEMASGGAGMKKTAAEMKDSELNIELYRKIMAMDSKNAKGFIAYWSYIYPKEYAVEMADNTVETKQKHINEGMDGKKREEKLRKEKSQKDKKKEEKKENPKDWYKKQPKEKENTNKIKGKFPE